MVGFELSTLPERYQIVITLCHAMDVRLALYNSGEITSYACCLSTPFDFDRTLSRTGGLSVQPWRGFMNAESSPSARTCQLATSHGFLPIHLSGRSSYGGVGLRKPSCLITLRRSTYPKSLVSTRAPTLGPYSLRL